MKVAIVAEFYPRAADPVLGWWAHAQAVAARDAGADVRVLVLHRPRQRPARPGSGAARARELVGDRRALPRVGGARRARRAPRHRPAAGARPGPAGPRHRDRGPPRGPQAPRRRAARALAAPRS